MVLDSIKRILASKSLQGPDGRPLYAYDVSDDDFRSIGVDVRRHVAQHHVLHHDGAAAFCLYAAEYFARGDGTDWWTYEGVTHVLSHELPQQELREAIAAGLRFWRRRVLTGGRGSEYLATLVCEGGLPLKLLQNEGGRLRRYFSELLRQHETYPTLDLEGLAAELASVLPVRMQNPVVYALACALIRYVAVLRDPAARPSDGATWPAPLRLDSELARDLLAGLRDAPRTRATSEPGIAVRTTIDLAHEPILRRQLVLPRRVSLAWLREAMPGLPDLPPRWYVALVTASGTRWTVGVATSHDDGYELRTINARDVARADTVTQQLRCVVSFDERDHGAFVPSGGEGLSDSPWTFSDLDDEPILRATGSHRSRADSLLLVLPRDARFELEDGATTEPVGDLLGLNRQLVRLRGSVRIIQFGDRITIATGQVTADERCFELRGSRVSPPVRNEDLWLGRPQVVERDEQGTVRSIPQTALQWRPRGGTWSSDAGQALGDCDLRVSLDGQELRTCVRILPRDFALQLRCGKDRRGAIEVRSTQVVAAGLAQSDGYVASTTAVRGGFDIVVVPTSTATLPGTLELNLKLSNGCELPVTTPFPVEQLIFTGRNGQPLSKDELCSLDDLSHIRALAMSPQKKRWAIGLRAGTARLTLTLLPEMGGGLHEMQIEPLRPTIAAALATDASLDNEVQLRLEEADQVGGRAPSIRIRRYGAPLVPVTTGEVHDIVLDPEAEHRLGEAVVESLQARAVPLAEPDRPPVVLPRVSRGRWNIDIGLEPGRWLVMAYQNDYLRTRPLRVTVPGDSQVADDDPISQAMSVPDREERAKALEQSVALLGSDTTGPGWATVRRVVSTLGSYPSGTFDLVRAVTRCPRVAVLSLLDGGPRAGAIWTGLEDLPFLWVTVPVCDWLEAIQGWLGMLRALLPTMPADFERTVAIAAPVVFGPSRASRFLGCLHDAAYLSFSGVPEPTERSVYFARSAQGRAWAASLGGPDAPTPLGVERNQLLIRHTEDHWPLDSPFEHTRVGPELDALGVACVAGVPSHKENILTTPIVLAQRSVDGAVTCDLLRLRQIRDFDPDWFDFAFALALSTLLGARYERKEDPFHE